ncbi:MAG: Bug family tripartite tricarboxylate transporter substrate binding protein [Lautropia sp.]
MKTRSIAFAATLLAASIVPSAPASAQGTDWPARPVRIVVPFSPGSFTDVAARTLATELSTRLGQPFVVENRGGAGGTIGASVVASAAPDGYTLLVTDNSFVMSAALYPKLPYDPLKGFVQVSQLAEAPSLLMARPGLAASSVPELVALAKARPGELNFGSGGIGSSAHLATELLMNVTDVRMTHVPFKGVAAAIAEMMADRIDVGIASLSSGIAQVRDRRIRALAVSGSRRSNLLPDTPTFAESGIKGYDMSYWWGIAVPAGTPEPVVDRLNAAVRQGIAGTRLLEVFAKQGAEPVATTPTEITRRIEREITVWKGITARAGVKLQ